MYGVADGLMQRLQAVQNAAARLVNGTRRRDHITPVIRQLHLLPVRQRVNFKLAVLVFKVLHGPPSSMLPGGRLSTGNRCRPSPTPFVRCRYMCTSTYQHALAIGRLEFPDHLFGTVSPLNSANLISLLDSSAER